MAIVKCKECNNDISSKAAVCPNCGYRIAFSKGKRIMLIGLVISLSGFIVAQTNFFLFILILVVGGITMRIGASY